MSAPLLELPETCRRLRQLEDAIAAQRKIIAHEKGADMSAARERLAQLLRTLDRLLKDSEVRKYPQLARRRPHAKGAIEA
jgi:hypothetical protein